MMKLALIAIALVLFAGFGMSATSDEETATANVTVNTYVSISITDNGAAGINFSSLDPGIDDNPEVAQTALVGAVTIANDVISNTNVGLYVNGEDFSDGGSNTFAVGQVTYDDDNTPSEGTETVLAETAMTNNYPGTAYYTTVVPGTSEDFWFFLDVPTAQAGASYTSIFSFKGE